MFLSPTRGTKDSSRLNSSLPKTLVKDKSMKTFVHSKSITKSIVSP